MQIGSIISASSDFHDIRGIIVGGFDIDTGEMTTQNGREISLDDVVAIRAADDGKVHRCNGWLWSFDAA